MLELAGQNPSKKSRCCDSAFEIVWIDTVKVGLCNKCKRPSIRVNPRTQKHEWLNGEAPGSAYNAAGETNCFGSVAEAKAFVEAGAEDGVTCPCCGQLVKKYKRVLNSGMAVALIVLDRLVEPGQAIHVNDLAKEVKKVAPSITYPTGEVGKMVHWGLVEQPAGDDPSKKASGLWRITAKGAAFVSRQLQVPSHVHLLGNVCQGFSDRMIWIEEALGEHFDYQKLWNGIE